MKNTSRLFLFLMLVLLPMAFSHAYDGPGQLVTLMTVQKDNGSFHDGFRAVDGELRCVNGNAYVNGYKAGEVWINLGADYYVEGMEILVRTEDETQDRQTGIYAECYSRRESNTICPDLLKFRLYGLSARAGRQPGPSLSHRISEIFPWRRGSLKFWL